MKLKHNNFIIDLLEKQLKHDKSGELLHKFTISVIFIDAYSDLFFMILMLYTTKTFSIFHHRNMKPYFTSKCTHYKIMLRISLL